MTTAKQATPQKPPVQRIPSDDFTMTVDGQEIHPHAGEWIDMIPVVTIKLMRAASPTVGLLADIEEIQAAGGNVPPELARRAAEGMQEYYDELCSAIAYVLVGWNWTGPAGRPLPQPDGTAASLRDLSMEEIQYLYRICRAGGATSDTPAPAPAPETAATAVNGRPAAARRK